MTTSTEHSDYETVKAALTVEYPEAASEAERSAALAAAKRMQAEIDRLQGEKDAIERNFLQTETEAQHLRQGVLDLQAENTRLRARIEELEGAVERANTNEAAIRRVADDSRFSAEFVGNVARSVLSDGAPAEVQALLDALILAPSRETE